MRVAVVTEHRFHRTVGGDVVTAGPFPYSFWKRYLTVFDSVCIVARAVEGEAPPANALRSDGPSVTLLPLPDYRGPRRFLDKAAGIRRVLLAAIADSDAVILRLPSAVACLAWPLRPRPYGVEVVGDPWDALAPGAHLHPLRPIFRRILTRCQRRQCLGSSASLYVTRYALQRRYPPLAGRFTVGCSDVELPHSAFVEKPRSVVSDQHSLASAPRYSLASAPRCSRNGRRHPALVFVGSLGHLYKAPDVLLEAVAQCGRKGLRLRLTIVGDGQHREFLEIRARRLGIAGDVDFLGHLPFGPAVRRELDRADVFVLPSRQEGLPRALLEAMARALPAIGSTAGGIPELLAPEDLIAPNDATSLADKLNEVCRDPSRLARMSAANLVTAREYEETLLEHSRNLFLEQVRTETEKQWIGGIGLAATSAG